ncbi:hypothetical protein ACLOJK_022387 [Asimina triloba]
MVMGCREDYASSPSGSEVACLIGMLLAAARRRSCEKWMGTIRYRRWVERRHCFGGPCWIVAIDGAEDTIKIGISGCCLPALGWEEDDTAVVDLRHCSLHRRRLTKLTSAGWSSSDAASGGALLPLIVDATVVINGEEGASKKDGGDELATGFCEI